MHHKYSQLSLSTFSVPFHSLQYKVLIHKQHINDFLRSFRILLLYTLLSAQVSQPCIVTKKSSRLLRLISKSFINLNLQTILYTYKAITRPTLEYENVIWGPFYKGDENLTERVQKRSNWALCHLSSEKTEEFQLITKVQTISQQW